MPLRLSRICGHDFRIYELGRACHSIFELASLTVRNALGRRSNSDHLRGNEILKAVPLLPGRMLLRTRIRPL